MNRNLPLLSAFLLGTIFLTASCDKEVDPPSPVQENQAISDPNAFLSTSEVAEINFAGILYSFQHGSNNMIENVEESFSFEEEEDGVSFTTAMVSNYDLIYTDHRLSAIDVETEMTISVISDGETEVVAEETESYSIAVQYNSKNLLTSLTETHEGDYVLKLEREYNSENKLIKETQSEDGEEVQRRTFEWSGFNVTSEDIFYPDAGSNERKIRARAALRKKQALAFGNRITAQGRILAEENTYADFDDKINPLNVLSLFGFSNGLFISNNNPGRVNFLDSETEGSVEIDHTYDSQGRPTRYSITDPEEGPVTIEVEYKN